MIGQERGTAEFLLHQRRLAGKRELRRSIARPHQADGLGWAPGQTISRYGGTRMSTLSVLKFETAGGADQMSNLLRGLQKQQLITVEDAAVVTWPEGTKKPKTRQLHNMAGIGALDGAFWGMLFGLIFFIPI